MKQKDLTVINAIMEKARKAGIIQQSAEYQTPQRGMLHIQGRDLVNFSSCSYLGLESDQRIKDAMVNAINQYGSQFSSSRAYISLGLYEDLNMLLQQMFKQPVLITPTVTLGHQSNIPVLIGERDAVILDQQVHYSVQSAVSLVSDKLDKVVVIKHNRMDRLETSIYELYQQYEKVWYFADGVYSMYGDVCPIKDIYGLLEKYENFHLYIDDAHGMGWTGRHGAGYIFNELEAFHPRMFFSTSLNKSFAAAGGLMVYPDETSMQKVRNCGGTMTFCGPIQPVMLGAAIASAHIHLSEEIYARQQILKNLMVHFIARCRELDLPLVSDELTPIFFIGVGLPEAGYKIIERLMAAGYFVNLAVFPAVSKNRTGIRIPITLNNTKAQVDGLLETIALELPDILKENNYSKEKIKRTFSIEYKAII